MAVAGWKWAPQVLEGLERRLIIRLGSGVLAKRGAPSSGGVETEAQDEAWELGFWRNEACQVLEGLERRLIKHANSPGIHVHAQVAGWTVHRFQDLVRTLPRRKRLSRELGPLTATWGQPL